MKVLVIGQGFSYSSEYAGTTVAEWRDLGVATAFASQGCGVAIVGFGDGTPTVGAVSWAEVKIDEWDVVLLNGDPGLRLALQDDRVRRHGCVAMRIDNLVADERAVDLGFVRYVWATSPRTAVNVADRLPGADVFFAPWGAPIVASAENPWPSGSAPRVMFVGGVNDRFIGVLNRLSEDVRWETWFVGHCFIDGCNRGITDDERSRMFSPRVRFLSDLLGQVNGHGPAVFGSFWGYLQYASVGVNLSPSPDTPTVSCKIYDYLACGLPVVTEDGASNAGDVLALRAGQVVPWDDQEALVLAVADEIGRYRNRSGIVRGVRHLASWEVGVERLLYRVRDRQGGGHRLGETNDGHESSGDAHRS